MHFIASLSKSYQTYKRNNLGIYIPVWYEKKVYLQYLQKIS